MDLSKAKLDVDGHGIRVADLTKVTEQLSLREFVEAVEWMEFHDVSSGGFKTSQLGLVKNALEALDFGRGQA